MTTDQVAQRRTSKTAQKPADGPTVTQLVLLDVEAERQAQDAKWGRQDHRQQGGENPAKARAYYEAQANAWKDNNDARVRALTLGFDGILLEEVFEALAEPDGPARREELVQVAAVAVVMIEALDRQLSEPQARAA